MNILLKSVFILLSIIVGYLTLNRFSVTQISQTYDTNNQVIASDIKLEIKPPTRLYIPAIGVDADIEYVDVDIKGVMKNPTDVNRVAWFKVGALPGEIGSAVMAGHLNGPDGNDAVFTNLNKLVIGDIITTKDANGYTTNFKVTEMKVYDEGYAEEIFSKNDIAHLNLITCVGKWDEDKKSYDKRLVVLSDIVP